MWDLSRPSYDTHFINNFQVSVLIRTHSWKASQVSQVKCIWDLKCTVKSVNNIGFIVCGRRCSFVEKFRTFSCFRNIFQSLLLLWVCMKYIFIFYTFLYISLLILIFCFFLFGKSRLWQYYDYGMLTFSSYSVSCLLFSFSRHRSIINCQRYDLLVFLLKMLFFFYFSFALLAYMY